jgi:uncharacterized protein (DUF486 family)
LLPGAGGPLGIRRPGFSTAQLETIQEVITLTVFVLFYPFGS